MWSISDYLCKIDSSSSFYFSFMLYKNRTHFIVIGRRCSRTSGRTITKLTYTPLRIFPSARVSGCSRKGSRNRVIPPRRRPKR